MSTKEVEQSIKVVMFHGKPPNWIVWKEKWGAVAFKKGYSFIFSASDAELYLPKDGEDNLYTISTDANGDEVHTAVFTAKDVKQWIACNTQVFADLIMSMDCSTPGQADFDIVRSTKTAEYPNGKSRLAMQHLTGKFSATTSFALSSLYKKYA
jgi:hypothetical protein